MGLKKRRIVFKIGTSTLTNEEGKSNLRRMEKLALVLSDLQNMGNEIVLVSSGAIAVGTNKMRLTERPTSMRMKQAAAAVGQCLGLCHVGALRQNQRITNLEQIGQQLVLDIVLRVNEG